MNNFYKVMQATVRTGNKILPVLIVGMFIVLVTLNMLRIVFG